MVNVLLGLLLFQADPRATIREATLAVERDSAGPARARWEAAARANPSDRQALLALATLARLTYRYGDAEKLYAALIDTQPVDPWSVYARIGRAESYRINRSLDSAAADFVLAAGDARALGNRSAQAEALTGLGFVTSRLASADSALRILARAEPMTSGDSELNARLRCVRAPILLTAGKPGAKDD